MKEKIIKTLTNSGGDLALFAFASMPEFAGEYTVTQTENRHIVYVFGVSSEFTEALSELRKAKKVSFVPTQPLNILIDCGGVPSMPMVKKAKHDYKTDHWVPILLKLGDHE